MIEMKYIVHQSIKSVPPGPETIILFPDLMMHSDFKGCFRIISAGFVQATIDEHFNIEAHCYGYSESLHMGARSEDSLLAKIMLRNHI